MTKGKEGQTGVVEVLPLYRILHKVGLVQNVEEGELQVLPGVDAGRGVQAAPVALRPVRHAG